MILCEVVGANGRLSTKKGLFIACDKGGNTIFKKIRNRYNCYYLLALMTIIVFTFAGCMNDKSNEEQSEKKEVFAMDTYMTLTAYGENASKANEKAADRINEIEKLVSTNINTSEIYKLNKSKDEIVSEDTKNLIQKSIDMYKETNGAFDICIYPVLKLWGFTTGNYTVPSKEQIKSLLGYADAEQINVDGLHISFADKNMEIDLGGITKGYTSQQIMEIYKESGVKSGIVSLGGNVQALGRKPDGSKWSVGLEDPTDTSKYLGIISIEDKAVITSGGYERYFEQDGKTYHHIIDPSTGYPADSGVISATIISDDGTLADCLSTAVFIMGKDKAIKYWQSQSERFDMILVDKDEKIYVTQGVEKDFSSDNEVEIIKKSY